MISKKIILLFLLAAIASGSGFIFHKTSLKSVPTETNLLYAIELQDLSKKTLTLQNYKNKLLIINFWATWCAPCKKEMPSLDLLSQDKKFKNLQIFAVNMETPNTVKTKNFFSELNIENLEIYFDRNLNFVKEFKLRGVPTTILINKKGKEFARIIGEVNFQDEKFLKWLSKYD